MSGNHSRCRKTVSDIGKWFAMSGNGFRYREAVSDVGEQFPNYFPITGNSFRSVVMIIELAVWVSEHKIGILVFEFSTCTLSALVVKCGDAMARRRKRDLAHELLNVSSCVRKTAEELSLTPDDSQSGSPQAGEYM